MLGRRPLWHGVLIAAAVALIVFSLLALPQTRTRASLRLETVQSSSLSCRRILTWRCGVVPAEGCAPAIGEP